MIDAIMGTVLLLILASVLVGPFVLFAWVMRCREPGCTFFKCNLPSRSNSDRV